MNVSPCPACLLPVATPKAGTSRPGLRASGALSVLVACESSGVARRAFRALGHDAWSCDLQPADDGDPHHYQQDVRPLLRQRWDLVIAHPTCTRLTNSGVRWLHERNLWSELDEAADFFVECLNANADAVAVENPIPHGHALQRIGRQYDQVIQPWQFGHGETKATCLWLKNLPALAPTHVVEGREARIHRMPPSADRWKERSRTYEGIAAAMAEQWGAWLTGHAHAPADGFRGQLWLPLSTATREAAPLPTA